MNIDEYLEGLDIDAIFSEWQDNVSVSLTGSSAQLGVFPATEHHVIQPSQTSVSVPGVPLPGLPASSSSVVLSNANAAGPSGVEAGLVPSRDAPCPIGGARDFIRGQEKASTRHATNRDVRNLERWVLENRMEMRPILTIPATDLDVLLADFFVSVRKMDGGEYEPDSLTSMRYSIDRYLKENDREPLSDPPYHLALTALNAKRRELKKQGKGRRQNAAQALTNAEQDKLWADGAFGGGNGRALITTMWWFNGLKFGLRANDGHHQMRWGDVSLKTDEAGKEFLELQERESKMRDGGDATDLRDTVPRSWCNGSERCHVCFYKQFAAKRPAEAKTDDSPFYLTVVPDKVLQRQPEDAAWYFPRPMGKNTIRHLLKSASASSGLEGKKTNHSVRKTTVTTLLQQGVPRHKVQQVTGHKSEQSVGHFDTPTLQLDEHRHISNIHKTSSHNMCIHFMKAVALRLFCQSSVVVREQTPAQPAIQLPQGPGCNSWSQWSAPVMYQNCTFNIVQGQSSGTPAKRRRVAVIESDSSQEIHSVLEHISC